MTTFFSLEGGVEPRSGEEDWQALSRYLSARVTVARINDRSHRTFPWRWIAAHPIETLWIGIGSLSSGVECEDGERRQAWNDFAHELYQSHHDPCSHVQRMSDAQLRYEVEFRETLRTPYGARLMKRAWRKFFPGEKPCSMSMAEVDSGSDEMFDWCANRIRRIQKSYEIRHWVQKAYRLRFGPNRDFLKKLKRRATT